MFRWLSNNFTSPARLRAQGVLGMNERNINCISGYNPRHLFPLVDDKLQTKLLAQDYGLATPDLLGVIRRQADIQHFSRFLPKTGGFAIKPAKGSGGKGILVIQHSCGDRYLKTSGEWIGKQVVEHHLSNLISGLYSLGGNPDVAIIESLINSAPEFSGFTFEGVPDIRVIVYRGYPVMAMMRLSTHASDGKANLHQGALGVGINLRTGRALQAVQHDRPVYRHPDTGQLLDQLKINNWQTLLQLASRCYDMTRLGYLGADLVVDANRGPLVLELNARPGLAIQMANGMGLKPGLQAIDRHCATLRGSELPCSERVAAAQSLFATEVCSVRALHVE